MQQHHVYVPPPGRPAVMRRPDGPPRVSNRAWYRLASDSTKRRLAMRLERGRVLVTLIMFAGVFDVAAMRTPCSSVTCVRQALEGSRPATVRSRGLPGRPTGSWLNPTPRRALRAFEHDGIDHAAEAKECHGQQDALVGASRCGIRKHTNRHGPRQYTD